MPQSDVMPNSQILGQVLHRHHQLRALGRLCADEDCGGDADPGRKCALWLERESGGGGREGENVPLCAAPHASCVVCLSFLPTDRCFCADYVPKYLRLRFSLLATPTPLGSAGARTISSRRMRQDPKGWILLGSMPLATSAAPTRLG